MTMKVGDIYSTRNYEQFKILEGNRSIQNVRINKIISSISEKGYIRNPLVINERFEIIDGQGRYMALKALDLPIEYVVAEGAGKEECIALNAFTTPWTIRDYIESYASNNEDYKRVLLLIDEFQDLKIAVVLNAINGTVSANHAKIKSGAFKCTVDNYKTARELLEYASEFSELLRSIKGNKDRIYTAIMFCYGHDEVDNSKLITKMHENINRLNNTTDMYAVTKCIEDIYNFNSRKNHVYIASDYQKYLAGKYCWYENKYGKNI